MNGPTAEAIARSWKAVDRQSAQVEAMLYLRELVVNAKALIKRYADTRDAALVGDDAYIERWLEAARGIDE